MRVAFTTLGCRLNQFETEGMRQKVHGASYETVGFDDPAEVYVINSCSVTARAEQKCRQIARAIRRGEVSEAWLHQFDRNGSREEIRRQAALAALELLLP